MIAESENGLDWRPRPCPDIRPEGDKISPHHVFTLVDGSVGGAYLDPEVRDGFPLKIFAHRMGREVLDAARQDPQHPHHAEAIKPDAFPYLTDELTLVSKDGLHLHVDEPAGTAGRNAISPIYFDPVSIPRLGLRTVSVDGRLRSARGRRVYLGGVSPST